jgi:hypothetical protein
MGVKQWVSLAEIVLANLAWIGELDIEGWVIATAAVVAIGAALWIFIGPLWLLVAATLYLALLVTVKLLVDRHDRASSARRRA